MRPMGGLSRPIVGLIGVHLPEIQHLTQNRSESQLLQWGRLSHGIAFVSKKRCNMLLYGFYCTITSSTKYLEACLSMGPHGHCVSVSLWANQSPFALHVAPGRLRSDARAADEYERIHVSTRDPEKN